MFSPIKYGIVETWRFIKDWIRKYIKKDYSVEEQIKRNNFRHELRKYLKKNSYSFNDKQIELLTEFKFNECIKSKRLLIAKYEASLCLKKI